MVGVSNYPNWLTFPSNLIVDNDCPRVVTCDNIRLLSLHFLLHKEKKFVIVKERNQQNISVVKDIFSNIYSDSSQSALKYLKDIEVNIWNLLVITGNFNIKDNLWDLLYSYHSSLSDDLFIITDCFNLSLSVPTNWVPTRYSDNIQEANSVINLIFLQFGSRKMDNHLIHSNWSVTTLS